MKKIISLIVSIVLTVSVFTTAYASENRLDTSEKIAQEVIRIIGDVFGIVREEDDITQEVTGEIIQKEDPISQMEYGKEDLRKMVIQYANVLAIEYAPMIDNKRIVLPMGIIENFVDQSISFLQNRRAACEAFSLKIIEKILYLIYTSRHPLPDPFSGLILIQVINILKIPLTFALSAEAQYRALIEAKEHYGYRLNGNEALSTVQEEHVAK